MSNLNEYKGVNLEYENWILFVYKLFGKKAKIRRLIYNDIGE